MTYVIKYTVFFKNGKQLQGKIRAKNKMTELAAKCGLENYLKKKYSEFDYLVIHSCYRDNLIEELFGGFRK